MVQRQVEEEEEEDTIQSKLISPVHQMIQKQAELEKEEKLQIQTKPDTPLIQRQITDEEEEEPFRAKPLAGGVSALIHRQTKAEEEDKESALQAKVISRQRPAVTRDLESRIHAQRGGGKPLPESIHAYFEPRFGADFSQVRVHTDTRAAETAKSINARAFTVGRNIAFGASQYAPESHEGRQLLAHELTHTVQQAAVGARVQRFTGPSSERRNARTQAGSVDLVPYVPGILREQYPHLLKVLGGSELKGLQGSVDAYARYTKARKRRIAFEKERIHVSGESYGGGSSDVARWRRLEAIENREHAATGRGTVFQIDARLMLADDVRSGNTTNPVVEAYHKALYKRVTELPMVIAAKPELAFNAPAWYQFLSFRWGPNAWTVGHDKGLVRFRHLMAAQKLNLEYTQIVLGEQIKVMDKLIVLAREMGEHYDVEGRKLGEFDSGFWDIAGTDVFIGFESQSTQGLLGGYVNDATGRFQMTKDLYAKHLSKRSRVVLLSPGNWLHIYPTKPQFWSQQLTDEGDGYRYLNTARGDRSLNIQQIITSDARSLHFAKSRNATGWRTKNELSGFEQFAIGVIFGDAFEQSSGWAAFGQIISGLIPVVGQVADARDVAIGVHKIWTTGGKQGKLQTAFAMLGFVPFLGDAIKSSVKGGGKEVAEQAVDTVSKQIGGGVSESAGRQIRETAEKSGRDDAADLVGRKAEDVRSREGAGRGGKGSIRQAVRESASESAAAGEAAYAVTREAADDVTSALGHRLPDLNAPGLVDQLPVKLAGESHTMKVVQLGGWKQLWLCSECSSLLGLVDDAIAAGGKARDDLIGLRRRLKDLEWKLNAGKLSQKRMRGQLRAASSALERIARRNADLAGLQPFLAKRFDAAWARRYPKQMPDAAKAAKGKGYPPPPPDHHWVDNQGQLYVRRNQSGTGPELRYDPVHKQFVTPEKAGRISPKFAQDVNGKEAFDLLGGNDAKSAFGKFVKVLSDELGVTKKELVAELDARKLAGASQDTVRSALKEPYRRRLTSRLKDSGRLAQTATYKKVLAETADPRVAARAASFEEFLEISRKLGPADKGSLGEAWYQHWFAHRGAEVGVQSKLGTAQGLKEVRRLDIYEDHLVREVKNVSTAMGAKEADQLTAQVSAIGKWVDVKVANETIKSGYDSVRYAFLDPAGAKINAGWIVAQLQRHSKANLSFQILNKRGRPFVVSPSDLARLGPDGLKRRIVGWVE